MRGLVLAPQRMGERSGFMGFHAYEVSLEMIGAVGPVIDRIASAEIFRTRPMAR